jgi:hypothetical protein
VLVSPRPLQDALGGNTRTAVVACIAPVARHAEESISTLKVGRSVGRFGRTFRNGRNYDEESISTRTRPIICTVQFDFRSQ